MSLDYWYDGQLKRYWLQFGRIFEGFQFESGVGADGTKTLRTFPVSLGGKNRQVSSILRNGSENAILSTPRITYEMIEIATAPERRQSPNFVSTVNVWERAIDPATNRYTGDLGKTYSVERFMAIPYDMKMRLNIWTSNEQQKHQFMEQALILFNPALDIQTGDNPLDWTSLTFVELDSIVWSNRDLPIGTEDDIEISTLTFKVPIWLTPPAKVKKQNIIQQIIMNIGTMNQGDTYSEGQYGGYDYSTSDFHTRIIVTPGDMQCRVEVLLDSNNLPYFEATLLSGQGYLHQPDHTTIYSWRDLFHTYGPYRKGVSQFRLKTTDDMDDHASDIIGIFDFHPTEANKIYWTPDPATIPPNTLQAISGLIQIVNPTGPTQIGRWPGDGVLPEAAEGQRYLLASYLPSDPKWGGLQANENDIIQYINGAWTVVFDASAHTDREVILNQRSGKQLRWTGGIWVDAISGDYSAGYWRVFL